MGRGRTYSTEGRNDNSWSVRGRIPDEIKEIFSRERSRFISEKDYIDENSQLYKNLAIRFAVFLHYEESAGDPVRLTSQLFIEEGSK